MWWTSKKCDKIIIKESIINLIFGNNNKNIKERKLLWKKKIIFIILLLGLVVTFDVVLMSWNSEVEALSKYGSRGTEVRTIQEKLKRWGYYSGSVDGIYGSQTVSAVKSFQKKNGLTVDGIAGTQTLKAMGITSSSSSISSSNNSSNVNLLARVVYGG